MIADTLRGHGTGATTILSEFAGRTRIADISADAVAATKRHILDCAGVRLAAIAEPAGRIVLDVTRDQGGAHQARVFGSNLRTSKVAAAWANGFLSHLLDYDDTGFSHPTACILPAALAVGEEANATGADLVAAVCVGLEVFERVASSGREHEAGLRRRGFHPTYVYGCAAAAAAGNIVRLNPAQMAVAIGLALGADRQACASFSTRTRSFPACSGRARPTPFSPLHVRPQVSCCTQVPGCLPNSPTSSGPESWAQPYRPAENRLTPCCNDTCRL